VALQDGGGSPCIDENAVLDFVQGRLREAEVAHIDEHADGCLSCRQAIDEAVRAFRERVTGFDLPPDPLVTRFAAGDKLAGRYRIIRFIARGGMGEVYEAEDEMLGTHIALKTVAAPISDNPLAARRLKQEVNLARRITHPNVCRIFDLGVHHGGPERPGPGVLFITMELIAGISLAQRLRDQGPFSPQAALPIARAMAAAIGAAHRAGVIHRDFKSENVMLASGGSDGHGDGVRVVVMDFGLARGTSLSTHDSLEGRGLAGTLAYMAPEQLDGQKVGHAADIYALGVVMYEVLAGQLPFVPAPGEVGLAAVLTRLSDPAPQLRSVIPNIDARWNDVVAHCLERDIDRRLASADDVVRALADEVNIDAPAVLATARVQAPAPRAAPAGAPRSAWRRVGLVTVGLGGLVAVVAAVANQHRPAPGGAGSIAPAAVVSSPAPAAAPGAGPVAAPPAEPPGAPTVAPPKIAIQSAPARPTENRPQAEAAVDRPPTARRSSAPRSARRDRTAAAAPKRGNSAPTGPSRAAEEDPPKQPQEQHRSADPEDGFIFQ
jgi:tRNA A-37 threonylcarbamoyl transferase component Bud32